MKKIETSREKLIATTVFLQEKIADLPILVKNHVALAADVTEAMVALHDLVEGGCGINDIRKFMNVFPPKTDKSENEKGDAEDKEDHEQGSRQSNLETDKSDKNQEENDSEESGDSDASKKPLPDINKNHNGKQTAENFPDAPAFSHRNKNLKPGDPCPCCSGKLYQHKGPEGKVRTRVWFSAKPPIAAEKHEFEDLRCNLCKEVFKPDLPAELVKDGFEKEERFGYSAIAMIVILKYLEALPFYRLERISSYHQIHLPDSTLWSQILKFVDAGRCIFDAGKRVASRAMLFFGDDTTGKIRSKKIDVVPDRKTGKLKARDGCHSSVVVAVDEQGNHIVLVKTDIIYLGEWLDEILANRPKELEPPLLMGDGSNQNEVTTCQVIKLNCNQHARDRFKKCQKDFPTQCRKILGMFRKIFENDAKTKSMSPKERLCFHKENSSSIFEDLKSYIKKLKLDKITPDNSPFGTALDYFIDRAESLSGFLRIENAPVSNNISERQMIRIALLRNVCKEFVTESSAEVASIVFSLGLTAILAGIDPFDYFTNILRWKEKIANDPEYFFPWNYRDTVKAFENTS